MSSAPFVVRWRLSFTNPKYGLDKLVRLVLWTISLFMAPDGSRGFPSVVVIAARAGMSARQVMRCVQIAERGGWLQRKFAGFTGKGWKHHLYVPLIPEHAEGGDSCAPRLDDISIEGGDRQSPRYAEGGDRQSPKVVTGSHTNYTKNNPVKINNPVGAASDPSPPISPAASKIVKKKTANKKGRKTALPKTFTLTPDLRAYAKSKGIEDPEGFFEYFCDKCRADERHYIDWSAGFRTWVINEIKFKKERQNGRSFGTAKAKGARASGCAPAAPGKYDGLGIELSNEK